jgi:hypothetical protein
VNESVPWCSAFAEKDQQLDGWLVEQGSKVEVSVDDLVEAVDGPSKQ